MEPIIPITGTFLDEISHVIPHQNWGRKEWDQDFQAMKAIGIDTVILIRSGHKRQITYPSQVLVQQQDAFLPVMDLVDLFLDLSEQHGMQFFFGTYDSGYYWHKGEFQKEIDLNKAVVEEVWQKYGHRKAFQGWYLTQEVSRRTAGIIDVYAEMGRFCKSLDNNQLPTMISPWMDGIKNPVGHANQIYKADGVTPQEHEKEWDEVMAGIAGAVDIVAFQDGHVDFHELPTYLEINKKLADKHGLRCWTNSETFDRDMPIRFLPIKWEKLWLKLKAAAQVGVEKGITFEFSHFMSPNSAYAQAGHLYHRYKEYLGL
jgi:hypothetical protein